jgi:hypothetical protein
VAAPAVTHTRCRAREIYAGVPPGTKLWLRDRRFIDADPNDLDPLFD